MIVKDQPLTAGDSAHLERWIAHPGFEVLKKVLQSKAFKHELDAAGHLMVGTEAGNKAAQADIEDARKTRYAITLIKEIATSKQLKTYIAIPE